MTDPIETLQTAVRQTLIQSPDVLALVDADSIRSGPTRPDKFPSIILANPQTMNLGRAAGGQYLTRVFLDLHIWATELGANAAQSIGAVLTHVLWDAPALISGTVSFTADVDGYSRPSFTYMRDPDPDKTYGHGVGTIEAVLMWRPE